jgi:hypothetical protein
MYSVRSATHVSGPGRSMNLQLTLVHRPLEPELGVALATSAAAPRVQIVEAKIPAKN